jgi:hypothetical protein
VIELPKIVPYYRLSLSTWPLSNNKELFYRFRRVKPGKSHTTGSLICAKPKRRRDQSTTLHYIKVHKFKIITNQVFYIKVNMVQSLNIGNKTSGWYTWDAIHRVSLINIVLPLKLPTICCDRTAQNSFVLSPKPVHVAIKQ